MKNHILNATSNLKATCGGAALRLWQGGRRVREKLSEEKGQFVMDHAVVFVLIIVLGGSALVLLTTYLQNDLSTTLRDKINEFFR